MINKSLISLAINLLSKKEFSRHQLFLKLKTFNYENDDINSVLDTLEQKKFLSSDIFATNLANKKKFKYGISHIMQSLLNHKIDKDIIAKIKTELEIDEYERANIILNKRFISKPKNKLEYSKQVKFMSSRGFAYDLIFKLIKY